MRRELDQQKIIVNEKEKEVDELRLERDMLREEKNDQLIQYSKQLE